jgi:hypothetical protein
MIPPYVWRCWTVPARIVRAVPRHIVRAAVVASVAVPATVVRRVRRVAAHHAGAIGAVAAVVAIPATLVCIMVPGWYATPEGGVEGAGGGAPLVWYGGAPGGYGVPEGGPAWGVAEAGEIGGCCGVEERHRRHHHHHHVEHKAPVRIPEPDTLALLGFGTAALALFRRKCTTGAP